MHRKATSGVQYTSVNDPLHYPGTAEERAAAADERLIFQAALQVLVYALSCDLQMLYWIAQFRNFMQ